MRGGLLLWVALAACGRTNRSQPDAASEDSTVVEIDATPLSSDAALDAALVDTGLDAPPETLVQATITVALLGQPRAGERILINRRDGSFVGEGVTDANGAFAASLPDGGSLTWIRLDLPLPYYYTYADLHDGYVVNAGTPPPAPTAAETQLSISPTTIPGSDSTTYGVARFPDQVLTGNTITYPTTATGTVSVIQNGRNEDWLSVGYSKTSVTIAPGASVSMPSTIYQASDFVVDVVAPVLEGGLITATVVPFQAPASSTSRQEAANISGTVSITFPRFVYSEVSYLSSLHVYFETPGAPLYENHFTHYIVDSSVTQRSFGVADLADCPRDVVFGSSEVTIGDPPNAGDFAQYLVGHWIITVPAATTSFARLVVPADLTAAFSAQSPKRVSTTDSGGITYRDALAILRSTHYGDYATYTGDGHPYMRECWRSQ